MPSVTNKPNSSFNMGAWMFVMLISAANAQGAGHAGYKQELPDRLGDDKSGQGGLEAKLRAARAAEGVGTRAPSLPTGRTEAMRVTDRVADGAVAYVKATRRQEYRRLQATTDVTVGSHQKISDTEGGFTATLSSNNQFGFSVASLGDVNGDGVGDLAVGASKDADGGTERGAVYILFLNAAGTVASHQKISDTEGSFTATLDNSDVFGQSVAGLGDLDGDGVPDLAVGAYGDDDGGTDHGAVYILFLTNTGTVDSFQKISDTEGGFTATLDNFDFFGNSVASLGDVNGDGVVDLAVGAYLDDDGGNNRGAVYILFLTAAGTVASHQKISDTEGGFTGVLDDNDRFGQSVAGLGDVNGDGVRDLAVGAYLDDDGGGNCGAVYILFLTAAGTVTSHQKISNTASGFTGVLDDGDQFGISVAGLGDVNGDGVRDLAVGAYYDDDGGTNRGAVYILFLTAAGTVTSHQKISNTAGGFTGVLDDSDNFGTSVASLGDLNGDGFPDLAVGARYDSDGGPGHGAVYILHLTTTNTPSTPPPALQVFCTVFTDGLDSNIVGSDVCWRWEYEAQMGERVVCRPTVGPEGSAYNGCPSDHSRGKAAFTNKVYPYCACTEYRVSRNAAMATPAPLTGRACQKIMTDPAKTVCYPMLTDFNYMRGDDYKYYGCPVDMQACLLS